MVAAVIASVLLMMLFAGPIDGFDFHVPKGYIYFAMAFSVAVEMLNLRMRRKMGLPAVPPRDIEKG